eukprot:3838457-Rhodomonas_salina.2
MQYNRLAPTLVLLCAATLVAADAANDTAFGNETLVVQIALNETNQTDTGVEDVLDAGVPGEQCAAQQCSQHATCINQNQCACNAGF